MDRPFDGRLHRHPASLRGGRGRDGKSNPGRSGRFAKGLPATVSRGGSGRALASEERRSLSFRHTHTGETLSVTYCSGGGYLPEALQRVDHLLRDFRTGEIHPIDPKLLDSLHDAARATGSDGVRTADLRDVALAMKRGGVGYYGKSDFVHVDTGRFRTW